MKSTLKTKKKKLLKSYVYRVLVRQPKRTNQAQTLILWPGGPVTDHHCPSYDINSAFEDLRHPHQATRRLRKPDRPHSGSQ